MRHAPLVIATVSACLLLQQARAQQTPTGFTVGGMPGFNVEEMSRRLLQENLQEELQLLTRVEQLLGQEKPAEQLAEIQKLVAQLKAVHDKRPELVSSAGAAGGAMMRTQKPDRRGLEVKIAALREKHAADSGLSAVLRELPMQVVSDAERIAGRDKLASLVKQNFEAYSMQRDAIVGAKDAATALAAVKAIEAARAKLGQLEQEIAQLGDVYLTREDLQQVQTPFREGWQGLREEIVRERDRVMQADCYGVKELEALLPR